MGRLRVQLAVSADGFIAVPDRSYAWLSDFSAAEFGFGEFIKTIGACVLGRTMYDEIVAMGPPPIGPMRSVVVTSRPLPASAGAEVTAVGVANLRAAVDELRRGDKDIWLCGGSKTIAACLDLGLVDSFELAVIPRLLGDGVPLFLPRPNATIQKLVLREAKPMSKGVVWLDYAIAR
jgi:dihydrofolate reductase